MLWSTWGNIVVAVGSIIVSGYFIYKQINILQRQNEISQRQFELSEWQYKETVRNTMQLFASEMTEMIDQIISDVKNLRIKLAELEKPNAYFECTNDSIMIIGDSFRLPDIILYYWGIINKFRLNVNGFSKEFDIFFDQLKDLYLEIGVISNSEFIFPNDSIRNNINRYYEYCNLVDRVLCEGKVIFGNFLYTYITNGDLSTFSDRIDQTKEIVKVFRNSLDIYRNIEGEKGKKS
ncbi:MAG: hypothetical protein ACRC0X_05355 [Brevinema sp.]